MSYVLAADLGGTKIAVAVVDAAGRILARRKAPINNSCLEATADQAVVLADEVLLEAGLRLSGARGLGVAVPGIYWPASGRAWAPNLWGTAEVPLAEVLASRITVRTVIDSDRSAYVLGEQWVGAARGLRDVVFLAVGTGIGAGIITGGRLCRGAGGIAGAVGWSALTPAWRDEYRALGCFEAEAAGPALARKAGTATAEQVAAAARAGDPGAVRAIQETAGWIAMGVANIISLLNPEMVVLGGGLMQAGDLLLEPIRRQVRLWAQPLAAGQVRIELTRLGEDAGLLGAARLVFLEAGGSDLNEGSFTAP